MYIQDTTRKLYSNRFIVEMVDLVDEHKDSNESRTHFIENAIIEKLTANGHSFERPRSKEENELLEYEISDID